MTRALLFLSVVFGAGALVPAFDDPGPAPPLPKDTLSPDLHAAKVPFGLRTEKHAADPNYEAVFALGRRLFFDPILSADRTVSCASCHQPEHGFASPERFPRGVYGKRALRHAPSLFNRAMGDRQSWDGAADTLTEQVVLPISNVNEMDLPLVDALKRLRQDADYDGLFAKAFPAAGVSRESLSAALETFVAGLYLGDSPIDRFHAGQFRELGDEERLGLWVFESKGGCWKCHSGSNFTDEGFHNTGVGVVNGRPEPGRSAITREDEDLGAFKTPTLRGVALTPPYMHDGSIATLEEVVEFYGRGGNPNHALDERMQPVDLTDREKLGLVRFLEALSRVTGK